MTALTKMDVAAIRSADVLCVHLGSDLTKVRAIKRKRKTEKDPFQGDDMEHEITANVTIETPRGREAIASGAAKCFGYISIYRNQRCPAWSILSTLKADDEITFRFWPDAHTNGYVAMQGLHADVLYMDVRRKGKHHASWELQTGICVENSARMCRGVPPSDTYHKDGEETRSHCR